MVLDPTPKWIYEAGIVSLCSDKLLHPPPPTTTTTLTALGPDGFAAGKKCTFLFLPKVPSHAAYDSGRSAARATLGAAKAGTRAAAGATKSVVKSGFGVRTVARKFRWFYPSIFDDRFQRFPQHDCALCVSILNCMVAEFETSDFAREPHCMRGCLRLRMKIVNRIIGKEEEKYLYC